MFIVSDNIISRWGVVGQYVRDRDISDYYPIWLRTSVLDWSSKPFKSNICWFKHKYFEEFIRSD